MINTHFINWPFTRECPFYKLWFRLQVEQVRYPRVKEPITYTSANKTKGFLELCHRLFQLQKVRPRAVVFLSSEQRAANEKVKLCKLMIKRRRDKGTSALVPHVSAWDQQDTMLCSGGKGRKHIGKRRPIGAPLPPLIHYRAWSQATRGLPAHPSRVLLMYFDSKEK